ncbi:MAG TPA: hypothetical protein VFH51_15455 [Myxococcota bacterium]|nr:hypothetical protein [Myxococcota bacterium]
MLTARMKQCHDYIAAYAAAHDGLSPSFEEIGAALGLRSKSAVHRLISRLEERGKIVRVRHRARTIQLAAGKPVMDVSRAQFFSVVRNDAGYAVLVPLEVKRIR